MSATRVLIKDASVVTLDPDLGDFPRADILVEDGDIVAVGPDLGASDAETIDASGQIAIPGFANTHLHTWQHALRGVCCDWTVKDYVRCWRIHLGPMYRPEDMYAGNYAGALDALNNGVTLVVDYCHNVVTRDHAREALRGLRDAGVRALFGLAYTPVLDHGFAAEVTQVENEDLPDHDARVRFAHQLAEEEFSSKDGLVTLAIVPQEIEIADWDDVAAEFRSARELDAWISIHANQVLAEQRWEDVRKLHRADLLGPDILFVHCSFSADDELQLIADSGASVSVQAETEMQMGMGFPITAKLIEHGVAPSLGVDITSNGSGDMFAQMRMALQVGRMLGDQPHY
ncbi:MAG TPA: amidohydrolase family protein, partial [Solirubrobacterales bacterium]|nr:amidohydrolase family protein [Solirubrobacterales bacterium]